MYNYPALKPHDNIFVVFLFVCISVYIDFKAKIK